MTTGHRTVPWDIFYKRIDGPMSDLAVMANILLPKRRVTGLSPKINLSKVESQSTYQSPLSKPQNQEPCSILPFYRWTHVMSHQSLYQKVTLIYCVYAVLREKLYFA